jgi:hypothetical protein
MIVMRKAQSIYVAHSCVVFVFSVLGLELRPLCMQPLTPSYIPDLCWTVEHWKNFWTKKGRKAMACI